MKKIFKVIALVVFWVMSIMNSESFSYAMLGGNASQVQEDKDESVNYVLNIRYVKWDQEDGEPFPGYTQGENFFPANTKLRLPVVGEVIGDKKVKMISCGAVDENICDYLSTKIMNRESLFEMPASDLSLSILFKKDTEK